MLSSGSTSQDKFSSRPGTVIKAARSTLDSLQLLFIALGDSWTAFSALPFVPPNNRTGSYCNLDPQLDASAI